MSVMVSGDREFVYQWQKVCKNAGASIVSDLTQRMDYVVVSSPKEDVIQRSKQLGVPCVSVEFVCQCLFNQQILHHELHPYFHHSYIRKPTERPTSVDLTHSDSSNFN